MLNRRFTLRRWVHEPGELDRASDGSANGQGLQSSATASPLVAHRAAPRRSKPQVLRAACFFAATLVVSGASAGLAAVPAQAGGTTPGISAPANVVVGEADGSVTLPVTLSAASTSTVTVGYATANGSGESQTGCVYTNPIYEGVSGTLTFNPGVTTQDVTVNLLNCGTSLSTGFYTFYLNLSSPSGATIVSSGTQIDVTGDAPASSTPGLFVKNAVVDATAGTVQVPVLLGGPSGASLGVPVTVNYATSDGSAKAGTDYTQKSGTLNFPAGATARNITVPILDPSGSEPTRSFSVTLSSPSNATIATATATVTIGASGASAVTNPGISAPPNVVVGETDGYIDLPVTLSAPGINTVSVNYTTANGSGESQTGCYYTNPVYQGQSGTLTFTPGVTTEVVRVPLLNCGTSLSTGFYTFYLNLSGNSGASLVDGGTQIDVTGDAPGGSTSGLFVKNAVVDATAGTVQVPVLLGGPSGASLGVPVTVNYATVDGSAKAGTDYTQESGTLTFPAGETAQNITVPILDPSGSEPTRSFSVTLSSPSNATIATATATVTIGASGASAVTNPGISAPPNVVVGETDGYIDLPVTLSAPGINTVSVNYTTANGSGESQTGCYYTNPVYQGQSGTLTFTPGVTTEVVRVPLLNCGTSLSTGFYTFYLNLSGNSGASLVDGGTQIDVTGDAPGGSTSGLFVKNAVVDATVGTVQVPVLLGGPSGSAQGLPVTVNYTTVNGSAKSGTDYTQESGTLTFPAGETAQNIAVPIRDHSGATRSFSVTLSSPSSNATIATGSGTITIGANSGSAVTNPGISAPPNVVVGQTDGYIDLPVTLSAPGINTVSVNYTTANGSGESQTGCYYTNPVYQGQSGTLTFTPGVTTEVVRVPLLNCGTSLSTGFYTFYLNLSGNSGASLVDGGTQIDVTGDAPGGSTSGLFVKNAVVDATVGHGPGARAPRRAFGLGPGPSGHGQLHDRERLGEVGHRLHPGERHLDLPGR